MDMMQQMNAKLGSQGAALDADAARAIARIAKPPPAASYARLGMVFGNEEYPDAPLKNPINDATAVGGSLRRTRCWDVTTGLNQTGDVMFGTWRGFVDKVRPGDAVLLYFAGHGCEFESKNYLLPLDFPQDERDLPRKSLNLHDMLEELSRKQVI